MTLLFDKPQPGDIVTVTTTYPSTLLDKDFDINTYENIPVVQSEKFDKPNTFRIPAIGEPYIRQRVIQLAYVTDLSIDGQAGEVVELGNDVKILQVTGSKNNTYTVTIEGNKATCTCKGYQFRHNCRHVSEALEKR